MILIRKYLGVAAALCFAAVVCAPAMAGALAESIGVALGESCVIPIEADDEINHEMRKNHMMYLLRKRDETMHQGIRTKQHSLKECVDCHATVENGQPVKVNAPGQFCAGCHTYAAVTLDCFQCHATVPAKDSARLKAYREKSATSTD